MSIITDPYSHKIVNYRLHPTPHSEGSIDALQMATKDVQRNASLIHLSDCGTQNCCAAYVTMIEHLCIQLSMTEKGDPYENAKAEPINGISKYGFGLQKIIASIAIARVMIKKQ